ncbi:MAG TPA: hypothetical protein VNP37_12475, partial [Actinomycetospora sp.]|nr:hypothetical protein [Actinomycetospora sp.]
WNHLPDPAVLARLAAPALRELGAADDGDRVGGSAEADLAPDGGDAPSHPVLAAASALLAAALDDGGSDNATLALVPVVPPAEARERPSVAVDARGPDERTGPIPLDGEGVVDR